MKKKEARKRTRLKFTIGVALVIAITGGIFLASSNSRSTKINREGGILSVNDIQSDPYAYKGTITITGVVADKSKYRIDPEVFLIVETTEAKICKITGCAKFYLPVRYKGVHPKEWDEVNVTGSFVEGNPFFVGNKVEVLRHLTF